MGGTTQADNGEGGAETCTFRGNSFTPPEGITCAQIDAIGQKMQSGDFQSLTAADRAVLQQLRGAMGGPGGGMRRQQQSGDMAIAYDIMKNEYVDMFEAGIIDPCKVTRSAVENAASIAAMILSTEALITDIPEPPKPAPAAPPEY